MNRSHGSESIELQHGELTEGPDAKGVLYSRDEIVHVIRGQAEVSFGVQTERIGPGSTYFVPVGIPYDFKVVEGPFESVAAFARPRDPE